MRRTSVHGRRSAFGSRLAWKLKALSPVDGFATDDILLAALLARQPPWQWALATPCWMRAWRYGLICTLAKYCSTVATDWADSANAT